MNGNRYMIGADVLGASMDSGRILTVKVKNISDVVKTQGGASGALANMLVPQTIEKTVYSTLADKLKSALSDQGVDADVQVASTLPTGQDPPTDLVPGMALGAGLTVGGYFLVNLLRGLLRGRR